MKILSAFKEHKEFKKNKPWSYWDRALNFDAFITPPHYAETIEILVFNNVEGDVYIGGNHFSSTGNQVYFVAPNVVHAINYKASNGKIMTLKINPVQLKPLLDLDTLLEYHQRTYSELPINLPKYEEMLKVADVFKNSDDINEILISILNFFSMLIAHSNTHDNIRKTISLEDNKLRSIIEWTEQNCMRKLSLDEVSSSFGYTKHYFCQKFKKATGITYVTYLNTLRISRACKLLKSGKTITQTCDECGFEDISYFSQLFKKITGLSPKNYVRSIQ